MRPRSFVRSGTLSVVSLSLLLFGCGEESAPGGDTSTATAALTAAPAPSAGLTPAPAANSAASSRRRGRGNSQWLAPDARRALDALPEANVAAPGAQGLPGFIEGDLGRLGRPGKGATAADFRPVLDAVAPVFRLRAADLAVKRLDTDPTGRTHARYRQVKHGLAVLGGDLTVHTNESGAVYAVNGTPQGQLDDLPPVPRISADLAKQVAIAALGGGGKLVAFDPALHYAILNGVGTFHLVWQVPVDGTTVSASEISDLVLVDALTGVAIDNSARRHTALFRRITNAEGTGNDPGTFSMDENNPAFFWPDNVTFDHLGTTYNFFQSVFRRDSYNNLGGRLVATINAGGSGVIAMNASWQGDHAVFGSGDGVNVDHYGLSLDVVAHEISHGVTQHESGLIYSRESGALNESFSDVMAAAVDQWQRGTQDANTFRLGEDIYFPDSARQEIRNMANPPSDGYSQDDYALRLWPESCTFPSNDNDYCGVHGNSGISNKAFYLMASGGTQNGISVARLGMPAARAIFYRAYTIYLTSSANYSTLRAATIQSAKDLYDTTTATRVDQAWAAVGVAPIPANDNFANATAITGEAPVLNGTTILASAEAREPNGLSNFNENHSTVWYKWVAPRNGFAAVRAFGHWIDPEVLPFAGTSIPTLNHLFTFMPERAFRVIAGQTYRIRVSAAPEGQDDFTLYVRYIDDLVVYPSDLPWKSASNGFGPAERDKSNGGSAAGDGKTLTLAGVNYSKGLGVHGASDVRYNLAGAYSRFVASVGVDDEVGTSGSVVFQVWADGTKLYDSARMTGSTATKNINVSVAGRSELRLVVTDSGDGNGNDHADWADARLFKSNVTDTQAPTKPSSVAVAHAGPGGIGIKWNASTDNNGVAGYQVLEGNVHLVDSATASVDLNGYAPSSTHTVTVRGFDYAGNLSAFSNSFTFQTQPAEPGLGLSANYHNGTYFQGDPVVSRTDASINFDWGTGSPASGVNADAFSVRWFGSILPAHTQTYTFYAQANDGVRLWVDGRLIIDHWNTQSTTEWTGTIALQANRFYEIRMEMFDQTGTAVSRLSWSSSSQPKQIVPRSRLY